MTPPTWARAVVAAVSPPRDFESVAGDLHEEYVRRARSRGRLHADAWYCSQALRSIPSLLSYTRANDSSVRRLGIWLIVAFSLLAMLIVNEGIDDLLERVVPARGGLDAWPFFIVGWLDAACFGALIAAIVRTHGVRLVFLSALALVAFIAIPIATHDSSPLTATTWLLLLGAIPAMCVGAGVYQVFRRR